MGAAKSFSVSTNAANADLSFATPVGAADASLTVNGVSVTRSSNTVSDVVTGVTFDLQATNTGSPASVQVTRDTSGVKEKITGLVQAYNDMVSDFGILTGPKSEDEEDVFSGALKGDSTPRTVLSQIRQIFFGESDTKGSAIRSFRDLGISVDREGVLTLDEATLDNAIASNFEEVVQALAQRTSVVENGQTVQKRGLGVNLGTKLREIMAPSGIILSQSNSAQTQVSRYEKQLTDLEDRMERILARYTKQFAAMESLVGQITAMRENLKGQF
jgi:flagellar hook-associated protein 2